MGSYEILSPLGAGGMGEVYRATDLKLKRDVALKVLPASLADDTARMARFLREAEVLASLNHSHIAQIYGLEEVGNVRAIAMELVEGETLADVIKRGPIPVETAIAYAKQIASAFEYAHDRSVIHRDLKPANVQVTPDGVVKVLDFGLAKALADEPVESATSAGNSPTLTMGPTVVGMILGTAAYMSPEQAKGKPVDRRTDIWSFGVMLYEMVSGKKLFTGEETAEILAAIVLQEPKLDELPARLRPAVERCLRKDPRKRWYSMEDVRFALDEAPPSASSEPSFSVPAPRRSRVVSVLSAASALLLLALAALSFVHFREALPPEHALLYTVAPPEGSSIHSFAASPDGRLVVVAAQINGKRQLWLRPMDWLQWQAMPTTDDARYPFWSPDSRNIAFFADGKLRKIAAAGGPSQPLCDVEDGRGGSWNRDDVILFSRSGSGDGAILRVPAAGGVPSQITNDKRRYVFPTFLPDGRHFLYATTGMTAELNGIYAASLDGKESRRILPDASGLAFAPPAAGDRNGHILFLRENNLMAQPFDAARVETSGDVFPLAEHVTLANGNNYAPVTASENDVLFYWTGETGVGGAGFQMVWYDRSGKGEPVGTLGSILQPAISPDEKTIAFSKAAAAAYRDIWLRDVVRGNERRLTTDPSQNITPFWSPKAGDRIAFRSDRGGQGGDFYVRAASGAGRDEVLLSTSKGRALDQWSRDGRFIVYSELEQETKIDLWVLPLDGDKKPVPFLHSPFNELMGQLSPDSRWMAYTSDVSGAREVYVQPFPAADNEMRISLAGGEQPRWRGDGKELFYIAADGKMTAVAITASSEPPGTGPQTGKPAFKVGTPVPLFDAHLSQPNQVYFNYDVTADGKRFLVSTERATASSASATPPLTVHINWRPSGRK